MVGIPRVGNGMRIDNPHETKFMSDWHQEYPYQFKSLDGLVFWTPLVPVTEDLGPLVICKSSHKKGLIRLHTGKNINHEKTGAYAYVMENRDELINSYEKVAPLSVPGDLFVLNFLTLHASGYNSGHRSRWSMQSRYFNFNDPTGIKIDWKGSIVEGINIKEIHPELYID